jgi:hypothetical protein
MGPGDFEVWSNHFEYHAAHPSDVAQGISDRLTRDEVRLIAGSIASAQLGRQLADPGLLSSAERFAQERCIPHLARIVELVIHEELRHSSLLVAFMRDHWLPLKRCGWRSRLFGLMQWRARLDRRLTMLISAELTGIVYYRALESVTDCQRLRLLCRIIVSDKLAHVGFESEVVAMLRAERLPRIRLSAQPAQRVVFVCIALMTWLSHRSMLRRAGHDARSFVRCCLMQYDFYLGPIRPRTDPSKIGQLRQRMAWPTKVPPVRPMI